METKNFAKSLTLQGVFVMLLPYLDLLHSQLASVPEGILGVKGKLIVGALGAVISIIGRLRNGGLSLF